MNIFRKLWNSLVGLNDEQYINKIAELEWIIKQKEVDYEELEDLLKNEIDNYKNLQNQYSQLQDYKNELLEQIEDPDKELREYWNNKYKKAKIVYPGRYLPSGEKAYVPVNLMVTPNDPNIIQQLKFWGLDDTNEDPETLAPKIHKKYEEKYYKYRFDKNAWGKTEVWEYFYEMLSKAKKENKDKLPFDCDSHGQALAGFMIKAGIPRWRVRVVAGNCSLGGHSTLYVYSKVDNKWHHLNSTYGYRTGYDTLSEFPTHDDARSNDNPDGIDKLGIYKVWMSFNDKHCWYNLESDIPEDLILEK